MLAPTLALTPPCLFPQPPAALLAARQEDSQRCRCGQRLTSRAAQWQGPAATPARAGLPTVLGAMCPPVPGRNLVLFLMCLCCSWVFPFISILLPVKVKFISNGKPPPPPASPR